MPYDLSDYNHLIVKPGVCAGRPIIKGTSIEPEYICLYPNIEQVQSEHPYLKDEEILECFHYFTHQL